MNCQKCLWQTLFPLTFTAAHLRSHNAETKPDRESERRDSTVNKETEPGTGLCTPYLGIALFQITWRIRIVLLAIWEQRMIKLIRTAEYKAACSQRLTAQLWDFLPPYCTDEQCCLHLLGVKKGQKMQWFNLLFNKVFLLLSACPMISLHISLLKSCF